MMNLAIGVRKEFKVSSIELKRRGISYTVDTLKVFKHRFPHTDLVLIIGADNLLQFRSWKSPKKILQIASLAVYKRKGFHLPLKGSAVDFILLKGRMLRISSTEIRNKVKMGFPIRTLVPNSVALYIKHHALYTIPICYPLKRQFHENHRAG